MDWWHREIQDHVSELCKSRDEAACHYVAKFMREDRHGRARMASKNPAMHAEAIIMLNLTKSQDERAKDLLNMIAEYTSRMEGE